MKKVLIALDYHPTAQKIAEEGFALAKAIDAHVILIHVIATQVYYSAEIYDPIMGFGGYADAGELATDIIDNIMKTSQLFLNKSKSYLGDTYIQTLVREGDSAESILNAAKDLQVDIIVMGSHSRRWLAKILVGSTTERVLHHTSISLLIIPTKK